MVEASCHCGAVRFEAEAAPASVNDCTCSICRRTGALWAYYHPDQIRFAPDSGPTEVYLWNKRIIAFHRCRACGCLTHWVAAKDPDWPRMGVNARMMPPEAIAGAQRLRDGQPLAG